MSRQPWFERVGTLPPAQVDRIMEDVSGLLSVQQRSSRLGPNATVGFDRFWASPHYGSDDEYLFTPLKHDTRLRKFPALLEFLSTITLDSTNPNNELQINTNQYGESRKARTGWHRDSSSNGRSKATILTLAGMGEVSYIQGGRVYKEHVSPGNVCVFHNENGRKLHNVVNIGETPRVSLLVWQPTAPKHRN